MEQLYDPFLYRLLSKMKNEGIFRIYVPVLFLSAMLSRECWFGANSEDTFLFKKQICLIFFDVFTGLAALSLLEITKTIISVSPEIRKDLRKEKTNDIKTRASLHKLILDWAYLDDMYINFMQAIPSLTSAQRSLHESLTAHSDETLAELEEVQEENLPKRELGLSLKFQKDPKENLQISELSSLAESTIYEAKFGDSLKRELGPLLTSPIYNQTVYESVLFSL